MSHDEHRAGPGANASVPAHDERIAGRSVYEDAHDERRTDRRERPYGERGARAHASDALLTRRTLLGVAVAALGAGLALPALAQREPTLAGAERRRVLLRGGCVLTLDRSIGDFDRADVLIEGSTIAAVQPDLEISGDDVEVIDASRMIVMPGFVDTHRHMWQGDGSVRVNVP